MSFVCLAMPPNEPFLAVLMVNAEILMGEARIEYVNKVLYSDILRGHEGRTKIQWILPWEDVRYWRLRRTMRARRIALIVVGIVSLLVLGAVPPADDASGVGGMAPESLDHATFFWDAGQVENTGSYFCRALLGVGDVNQDGFGDILMAVDRRLQVMLGDGHGNFSERFWQYVDEIPYNDGDEIPRRHTGRRLERFEIDERDDGSFVPSGAIFAPYGVLGDVNEDGDLDLLFAASIMPMLESGGIDKERTERRLYLYLGVEGDGFERVGVWPLEQRPSRLLICDVNGDGRPDLWIGNWDSDLEAMTVQTVEQTEEGGFVVGRTLGPYSPSPRYPGDFDADGFTDFLSWTQEGEVVVYHGAQSGVLTKRTLGFVEGEIQSSLIVDLTHDGTEEIVLVTDDELVVVDIKGLVFDTISRTSLGFAPISVMSGRFDEDANVDLLIQSSSGYRQLILLPGNGEGGFFPTSSRFIVPENHWLRAIDFTGNGRDDLVDVFSGVSVYINGSPSHGVSLLPLSGSQVLCTGDLDGNSAIDLLVQSFDGIEVFWNDGTGAMVPESLAEMGMAPMVAAVGEGSVYALDMEMIGGKLATTLVQVAFDGEELGRWHVFSEAIPLLAVGDFDADGVEDVAIPAKDNLLIHWGGTTQIEAIASPGGELSQLVSGDFDGNGIDELVAMSTSETADLVVIGFQGRLPRIERTLANLEIIPLAMTVADVDGDGIDDPICAAIRLGIETIVDYDGDEVEQLYVAGTAIVTYGSDLGLVVREIEEFPERDTPWPFTGLSAGDVDGDGVNDIVLTTVNTGELLLLTGVGDGTFELSQRSDRANLGPIYLADLDGNGRADIIGTTAGLAPIAGVIWNGELP
jgi:FG-GAP-like repeat